MRERLARWWAHRKLHRGRCQFCREPLRDDYRRTGIYRACSEECDAELIRGGLV